MAFLLSKLNELSDASYSFGSATVLNGLWRSFEIQGNNCQAPISTARTLEGSKSPCHKPDTLNSPVMETVFFLENKERTTSEVWSRNHRQILSDAKFPLENRDMFLDRF